jgi:hypothetical protein
MRKRDKRHSEEETGVWGQVYNKDLHNFQSLTNNFKMIKPRKVRWTWFVERVGEREMITMILFELLKERNQWENLCADRR